MFPSPQDETVLDVPISTDEPILAVGAELKSAPALMLGSKVYVSASQGRLDDPQAYRRFLEEVDDLPKRHHTHPDVLAYDLHPDYAATRWAKSQLRHHVGVQHHHAHIAACMAEHRLRGNVVGLACDGTGFGLDGTIWGGEVLVCDFETGEFQRAAHLHPFSLLGGDAAAVETYRPALGVLVETFHQNWPQEARHLIHAIDVQALAVAIARLGAPSARLPRTTSLGRLFDAVAFILGLCTRNDAEAQAPIAVQQAAEQCKSTTEPLPYTLAPTPDGVIEMDYRPMIREMVGRMGEREDPASELARPPEQIPSLARAFHEGVANMLVEAALRVCESRGEKRVVISGGCFLNTLLRTRVEDQLRDAGCEVYLHQRFSPGDECVAVGQAVVAAARRRKGTS